MTEAPRTVYVTLGILEEYMELDEMIGILMRAKKRAANEGITDVRLDISKEEGYYGSVDITLQLEGKRLETDEEVSIRLDAEQRETSARIKHLERELETLRNSK